MTYEPLRDSDARTDTWTAAPPAASDRLSGASERFAGARDKLSQGASQARGQLVSGFGRVVDKLEGQIHRAPADLQPHAQKAVGFARERPLVTMAGLAFAALFLTRGVRR